jgi:hypothetical protein
MSTAHGDEKKKERENQIEVGICKKNLVNLHLFL